MNKEDFDNINDNLLVRIKSLNPLMRYVGLKK